MPENEKFGNENIQTRVARIIPKEQEKGKKIFLDAIPEEISMPFIESLVESEKFKKVLEGQGIELHRIIGGGGFGRVYSCSYKKESEYETENNGRKTVTEIFRSVIKFSSYRFLSETTKTSIPQTDNAARKLEEYKTRESTIYEMVSEEDVYNLAEPFVVTLCYNDEKGREKVYDYIFCVNMPEYEPVTGEADKGTVMKIARDVLQALLKAHSLEIRHRDIKPENIMYDRVNKKYVLIDWGSSGRLSDEEDAKYKTHKHLVHYTPIYSDSARFEEGAAAYDVRVDLYSVGVLMAYMLHPEGYKAKRKIVDFYVQMCGNHKATPEDKYIKDVDAFCKGLKNGIESDDVLEIICKALKHEYAYASEMYGDINELEKEKAEKPQNAPDKKPAETSPRKPQKRIPHTWIISLGILLGTALLTLAFSGVDGLFSTGDKGKIWLFILIVALWIGATAVTIALLDKNNIIAMSNIWKNKKEEIISALIFVFTGLIFMSLPVSLVLGYLEISYPFYNNCIIAAVAGITYIFSDIVFHRKEVIKIFGGAVMGILAGWTLAGMIGETAFDCGKIISAMTCTGVIWSVIFSYVEKLFKTRLKRIKR